MKKLTTLILASVLIGAVCAGCDKPKKTEKWEAAEFEVLMADEYTRDTSGWPEMQMDQPPYFYVVRSAEQIPDFLEFEANDPVLSTDFSTHSLLFALEKFPSGFDDINTGLFVNINNNTEYSLSVNVNVVIESGSIVFPVVCPWLVIVKVPALTDEDTVTLDYKVNVIRLMKKTILLLLFVSIFSSCKNLYEEGFEPVESNLATRGLADGDYYWGSKGKIPIKKSSTRSYVLFKDDATGLQKSTRGANTVTISDVKKYDLVLSANKKNANIFSSLNSGVGKVDDIAALKEMDEVIYAAPYYVFSNGKEYPLTNIFYVELKTAGDLYKLEKLAAEHNVIISDKIYPTWEAYVLCCTKESSGNALEMANLFHETGLFNFAHPEFLAIEFNCVNDEFFDDQWNLKNTGQLGGTAGVDINYCNARTISTGSSDITIAVIDNGVDTSRPDLNISHTHDAVTQTDIDVIHNISDAPPFHGTYCIEIINSKANNGIGIAGIAPDCKLLSISTMQPVQYAAYAMRYAVDYGADVVNCSWDASADFQIINSAINYALTNGRGGLGCVLVFASGNKETSSSSYDIRYPSSVIPDIITVGSINQRGENMSSVFWSGMYFTLAGTSFAAPQVTGIAALILSVRPDYTQKQVAYFIEKSARKVGGYNYATTPGRPNGGWNEKMGYGLVNAYEALLSVPPPPPPTIYTYFTDQIVSNNTSVIYSQSVNWQGIWAENVAVHSGVNLILKAPVIHIQDNFIVEAGATFYIGE